MPKGNPGIPKTEEHKHKICIAQKGKRYSAETNKKKGRPGMLNPFYNHHHSVKTKSRLRILCPPYGNTPEANKKKGHPGKLNPFYGKHHTPQARAEMSKRKKELCQNPEYVKKIMIATRRSPNKSEMFLENILNLHFPGQWKYTGDGRDGTSIGGKVPDFININGFKAVIEVFSDYWHSLRQSYSRTAPGTLEHYSNYGFRCLILDYREVKKPERVIPKIIKFRESL